MKKKILLLYYLLLLFGFKSIFGQYLNTNSLIFWQDVKVFDSCLLVNAWAGGLNNCVFGNIDLNNDNITDLLVLDRHGNKLLTFVYNNSSIKNNSYIFEPQYKALFPNLKNWFQLIDYNNDSKPDIFTYTSGGIMVYKNVSDSYIKFKKAVNKYITSLQGNINTNLFVTNVDYPAITDIDNDGDYDILTFWGLGAFVELHQNLSMELYNNADSLVFKKTNNCWGNFAEGVENNTIILDTCSQMKIINDDEKHTGSVLMINDINNDNYKDLILSDFDYPNIKALINSYDNVNAKISNVIDNFPINNPLKLWSFPSIAEISLFNNNKKYFIASPFDPNLYKSNGKNSVWLYNINNNEHELISKNFLQNTMIDVGIGAYPCFIDINNDNLTDLIIGNFGEIDSCFYNQNGQLICNHISSLTYYKNIGAKTKPEFKCYSYNFANLSKYKFKAIVPTFADIDNDGDYDLLIGTKGDGLWLFENISVSNNSITFKDGEQYFKNTIEVKPFMYPQWIDIDDDGLIDLVVGEEKGTISYYKNYGTAQKASYKLISNFLGKVNTTDTTASYTGHCAPHFFRNNNNKLCLITGSESGRLLYFNNLTINDTSTFSNINNYLTNIEDGIRSSVSVKDIDNDGYLDVITGNFSGGLHLFKGNNCDPFSFFEQKANNNIDFTVVPNLVNKGKSIFIKINKKGVFNVSIINYEGKTVKNIKLNGNENIELNTSALNKGIYFICIFDNNNKSCKKLIVN